jgi:ribosomal protein S18 acetylase RimI-like enzyme
MQIETAIVNDIKSILNLQKLAFYQRGLDCNNMNLKPLVESLDEFTLSFHDFKYIKATIDNVLVGSARANELNGTCYISRLFVHPEYQGKGIGSKLLLEIEKHFRQKVKRFELFTGETNKKSISIYKNLGYSVFRRSDDYEVPIVFLEKNCIHPNIFTICSADIFQDTHRTAINTLVKEYFNWGNCISIEKHGFDFDIKSMYSEFLNELPEYTYPNGVLNLIEYNEEFIGIGGFKRVNGTICELKRIFIREKYRGINLGERLLHTLIKTAEEYGYEEMQLESAKFMINARALYSSNGFKEIDIYQGVESPKEYQSIIYCMRRKLKPEKNKIEDTREEKRVPQAQQPTAKV